MPELPEVETLRKGLEKYLVGHKIESVDVRLKRLLTGDVENVIGAKVVDVKRFGKGLVIDLNNDYSLAIHIKLTGQLVYRGVDTPKHINVDKERVGELPNRWSHIIFHLDKHATLYYNDIRQFGWIKIVPIDDVKNLPFFKELGPDILNNVTIEQFSNILSKVKTAIKPLLLDQKKFSGIGNIYANDSLYLAKINPKRPANSLSSEEVKALYDAIITVLKKGLEEGGASELTFVNVLGEAGNYQNHSLIYGHQGEKCKRDGTNIQKFVLAGRGTYICPHCQK